MTSPHSLFEGRRSTGATLTWEPFQCFLNSFQLCKALYITSSIIKSPSIVNAPVIHTSISTAPGLNSAHEDENFDLTTEESGVSVITDLTSPSNASYEVLSDLSESLLRVDVRLAR